MQKTKTKEVDSGLCDRFYSVFLESGKPLNVFAKEAGYAYPTTLNEIKRHICEPSKKAIVRICRLYKISANWLLFEEGTKRLDDATRTIHEELKDIKKILLKK